MRSARRLLLAALVAVVCSVSLVAAYFSYREGRTEAAELFDAKLAHSARVLAALVAPHVEDLPQADGSASLIEVWHADLEGRGDALVSADGHAYETKLAFQVRDAQGRLLLRSDSGPATPLAALRAGFADAMLDGAPWRVFTLRSREGLWVQAAEEGEIREELATGIARGTLAPLLLGLPVLVVLLWVVLEFAARGLGRIVDGIERRAGHDLTALDPSSVPIELGGLVRAINGLFDRVRAVLERERRFTADAAHELRTPLAALRVHVANCHAEDDAAKRDQLAARVDQALVRMERVIAQMLDLARQDAAAPGVRHHGGVDLPALVRREAAELGLAGLGRGLRLEVVGEAHAHVFGDEVALGIMLRNLLDNALRYTPDGGQLRIEVQRDGEALRLSVDDAGPGIPAEARERVFDRFHRELGSGATGSGLGLSIVQAVVARHGGRVRLRDSALGGLGVDVHLPVHPRPATPER
jgi:two-component system sensor histidine kinase QseC